jgi:hypothetical protein
MGTGIDSLKAPIDNSRALAAPGLHPNAGESNSIPAGAVRDATIHGGNALKVLMIYAASRTGPPASPTP